MTRMLRRGANFSDPALHWSVWLPLSLLAGWAQAIAMAAPWNGLPMWWLQLISLGLLAWLLLRSDGWRQAAGMAWFFALAWLTATFWWLFISMHSYGGLPAPLAVLAVLALAAVLALYYAAACGIFRSLAPKRPAACAVLFAALWLAAEMARGRWFTGFGWGASGYAHSEGPLALLAPWVGVYGLCAISAGLAMAGPALLLAGRVRLAAAAVLLLLLVWCLPAGLVAGLSQPVGRLSVTLLQGNIAQNEKFEVGSGVPQALAWYASQLQLSQTALVVAPETAIPVLPQQLPPTYWDGLRQRFATGEQAALIGIPLGDLRQGYTNSVLGLKPESNVVWRYDKHHLVPFGEFIPPFFRWFTQMMSIPLGDFNRGALGQSSFEWQGQRLALNICYEDLFGEELAARFLQLGREPTVFVNTSNIGWFGNSVAIDQHLNISRLRALEFERPFIRATNTGATVILDHRGKVLQSLPRHQAGVLQGEVEGRSGITPYAWWVARFGLWPLWLLVAAVLLGLRRRP